MKRFLSLAILLLLLIYGVRAQSIIITFEATLGGALIDLDSIRVMNLTAGGDTMIYFPDSVLVLDVNTGMHDLAAQAPILRNMPNPFAGTTDILVSTRNSGQALLTVHDAIGREVAAQSSSLAAGQHHFRFIAANPGVHVLTVLQGGERGTHRLVALAGEAKASGLTYAGSHNAGGVAKSDRSLFTWTPSDELRYIGYATNADIVHSAAIDEVPVVTATRTFGLFAGLVCPESPTVTDIDDNVYRNVQIGGQCWMAENLRTTRYRNGSMIPNVIVNTNWTSTSNGAWCNYGDDAIYGKLYNWYAAANPNICPPGWHVATDVEWQQLELALGMPVGEVLNTASRGQGQNIGGMLRATSLWLPPNTSATNESGFSGFPGGYRNFFDGFFFGIDGYGYWWSASESTAETAWYRFLYSSDTGVYRNNWYKRNGFCLRCVRD